MQKQPDKDQTERLKPCIFGLSSTLKKYHNTLTIKCIIINFHLYFSLIFLNLRKLIQPGRRNLRAGMEQL
jgi:hypothetical protein